VDKISIIVPAYNEEEVLPIFDYEVTKVLKSMEVDYEIIYVDDGSHDGTLSILKVFAEKDSDHKKYISFSRNFGKESAMFAGFVNCSGDYAAVMDADMQDPPALLPEMYEKLKGGDYDCAATRRYTRKGEPPVRSFLAHRFYHLINKISDANMVDGARDFRLMRREMVDAVIAMDEYNRFSKGIFGWVGFRTLWIPYENVERAAGRSKWSLWELFKYALDGIVNFSQTPLHMVSSLGIFMTLFSFVMIIVIIIRQLVFHNSVAGWTSMVCVMLLIGGIQILCLGIMGQYISKIYMESKNRPHYIANESNIKDIKKIR
jgi:glucosyltransferase